MRLRGRPGSIMVACGPCTCLPRPAPPSWRRREATSINARRGRDKEEAIPGGQWQPPIPRKVPTLRRTASHCVLRPRKRNYGPKSASGIGVRGPTEAAVSSARRASSASKTAIVGRGGPRAAWGCHARGGGPYRQAPPSMEPPPHPALPRTHTAWGPSLPSALCPGPSLAGDQRYS